MKEKSIIVSACLLGVRCSYNGEDRSKKSVVALAEEYILIPICPEQLGGLPTPRIPQVIQEGSGEYVLEGKTQVMDLENQDVTSNFLKGAYESLRIAQLNNCKVAILKNRSPSCGVTEIYIKNKEEENLVKGKGVTSALFVKNNILVISEIEIEKNPKLLESIIK